MNHLSEHSLNNNAEEKKVRHLCKTLVTKDKAVWSPLQVTSQWQLISSADS
jgi:hypothetical protein